MISGPRGLISIGLTSGLGSIACSVISVSPGPKKLWSEVMPGPRRDRNITKHKRYAAHFLMFEEFFYRWPPSVIALGPPSENDEPIEWVIFMRTALFELGKTVGVPVHLFDTTHDIAVGLGAPSGIGRGTGLKRLIHRHLPGFRSNKRRVILSTATAMAGAIQLQKRQGIHQ